MKAMILERFGGTERFAVATVPAPVPKRGEVLVTIKAAGVNPIDVKTRRGGGIADSLRRQRPMILSSERSISPGRAAPMPSSLRYRRNTSPSNR